MTDHVIPPSANDQVPELRTPNPDPFVEPPGCDACPEPYIEAPARKFADGTRELRIPCGAVHTQVDHYEVWRQMVLLARRHRCGSDDPTDGRDDDLDRDRLGTGECPCACCRVTDEPPPTRT